MEILAHRGFWQNGNEKNSVKAIHNALRNGFGFESDIRDYNGELVISHDVPTDASAKGEQVFELLSCFDTLCFAINIKSDGIQEMLMDMLNRYKISNYFVFEMSSPQAIEYVSSKIRLYTRQSDIEPEPVLYDYADGIWIDSFSGYDWVTEELLWNHIKNGKKICIASPDLHNAVDYKLFWERLKNYDMKTDAMGLCTDYPEEARSFFDIGGVYGKN